ncbi:MAG: SLC13 family permease [Thermoanaerobacterales bacterium]|nr:SLC13 family permease [Thermoanaerobacterales bacterium]
MNRNAIKIGIGPALYILALFMPFLGDLSARVGFGILVWVAYWWVSGAVPFFWTMTVPLLGASLVPILPLKKVIQTYIDPLIILILATCLISGAWIKWGAARRLALKFMSLTGNNVRNQVVMWFVLSSLISSVVADTITPVALAPVVIALLVGAGYATYDDRLKSKSAGNIMMAVAWGASNGGFVTPLAGGQALVVYAMLQEQLGAPVDFVSWSIRAVLPVIFITLCIIPFLRWGLKYDVDTFPGSKNIYKEELAKLGPMSRAEKVSLYGFLLGIVIVFAEPLFRDYLPYKIEPSILFLLIAIAMFLIPANKSGEKVLSEDIIKKYFPINALVIWPTAIAMARILEESGATAVIGTWLAPLATASAGVALAGFTGVAGLMTQFSTNTAANAVVVPIAIQTMKAAGQNIIPWIYAVGSMGALGYAVVSANGGMAVLAGYGMDIKRLFYNGMIIAAIAFAANWVFWYTVMFVLKLAFYQTT